MDNIQYIYNEKNEAAATVNYNFFYIAPSVDIGRLKPKGYVKFKLCQQDNTKENHEQTIHI